MMMSWFLSLTTVIYVWQMGNKSISGPLIGLGSQFLWFVWAIQIHQYGLIPSIIVLAFINVRNLVKWSRESAVEKQNI